MNFKMPIPGINVSGSMLSIQTILSQISVILLLTQHYILALTKIEIQSGVLQWSVRSFLPLQSGREA